MLTIKKWRFMPCILLTVMFMRVFEVTVSFAENLSERNENLYYSWVGDTIKLGTYEQDYNIEDGKEEIEWLVLEVHNGKALLLSKYALDCVQFHSENTGAAWDGSELREWLNTVFFENAFSDAEKNWILETGIVAQKDNYYGVTVNAGEDTIDRFFLMSEREYWNCYRYPGMDKGICPATKYCIAQGAKIDMEGNCEWWLRSPAGWSEQNTITCISTTGATMEKHANDNKTSVRPAMWIKFDSAIEEYLTAPPVMIHCPECGEFIKGDGDPCIYCGKPLSEFMLALAAQQIEKVSDAIDSYYSEDKFLTYGEFQTLLRNWSDNVIPIEKYYSETTAVTLNKRQVSPSVLTMYLVNEYELFVQLLGDSAVLFGLDMNMNNARLFELNCFFAGFDTWKDYFAGLAIETLKENISLLIYAEENGITISEEEQQDIDAYCTVGLDELATEEGYTSAREMISEACGIGNTPETLKTYLMENRILAAALEHLRNEISLEIGQGMMEIESSNNTETNDYVEEKINEWIEEHKALITVEYTPFLKITGHFPEENSSSTGVKFSNGDVYEGAIENGKQNGIGTMFYANGDIYEGEWVDGQIFGQGTYTWANNTAETPHYYTGEFKDGESNGWGIQYYPNGKVYIGEWKDGQRNDRGKITYANGDVYEGEWVDDLRSGEGTYTWADSTAETPHYYTGEFKDGKNNGMGTQYYLSGNVYIGEWKDDQRSGHGKMVYANGDVYEGEWVDGLKSGEGTYTWADSTEEAPHVYIGGWAEGRKNGYGIQHSSDGSLYEGMWENGEYTGK